jgi:hypothetical protein
MLWVPFSEDRPINSSVILLLIMQEMNSSLGPKIELALSVFANGIHHLNIVHKRRTQLSHGLAFSPALTFLAGEHCS